MSESYAIIDDVVSSRRETVVPEHESTHAQAACCFHCGESCKDRPLAAAGKAFCCRGCLTVYELLTANGLGHFYDLGRSPGIRRPETPANDRFAYLDDPAVQLRLLDFMDGKTSRVTFFIPAIHCVACVWLLENLFQLHPGVGLSRVHFTRRELSVTFAAEKIRLSTLVELLSSIGYEPRLTLAEMEKPVDDGASRRRWMQMGVAGFAFGNIMLFSLPAYFGWDSLDGRRFQTVFGYASLALALPVLLFSASDYWQATWLAVRRRRLTLEVPIALGLAALYLQSLCEVLSGRGAGYLDSMTGLVFFLLCGRAFQQTVHARLAFDRDYKSFFPLATTRIIWAEGPTAAVGWRRSEEQVPLSQLKVGDRLVIRNNELIPADATLLSGPAMVDYSFVTGESLPTGHQPGDHLYAGGRQMGSSIEIETVKPVSQSYLMSLWQHDAFRKSTDQSLDSVTNRYSRRFTRVVIAVAVGAALFWITAGDYPRALKAFTSVLIVACPCALALAAPFALGTAQRWLERSRIFLKNSLALERLSAANFVVFDKTGTLTTQNAVHFEGTALDPKETNRLLSLARHSTHPLAVSVSAFLQAEMPKSFAETVTAYREVPGRGIAGNVNGHRLLLGSTQWLAAHGIITPPLPASGAMVCAAVDGTFRGVFRLRASIPDGVKTMFRKLPRRCEIALLSGDNERERLLFSEHFETGAHLHFNQSPIDKLNFIRQTQATGRTVVMVGDGLNDAGALKQSDVGVAVVGRIGAFSPASDVILEATQVGRLAALVEFARRSARIVRISFGISAVYNLAGVSIAAAGVLSPLICAILMPLSSASVVLFACGATTIAARCSGFLPTTNAERDGTP